MDVAHRRSFGFNPAIPTRMCVDINSCFATIEQQANPLLRGKPVAVAAYTTSNGCILAASREAKSRGVKTGMPVWQGRELAPSLVVLSPDPDKYRYVNHQLTAILRQYTPDVAVKSIDEMFLSFENTPALRHHSNAPNDVPAYEATEMAMYRIASSIKSDVRRDIGEWMTVSVGVSSNRYLAKLASGLKKPDGFVIIDKYNVEETLRKLKLEELVGIKHGYGNRLRCSGIGRPIDMYHTPIDRLQYAFSSVIGYHWWLRLHGWEADDREFGTKSFGHSYALGVPYVPTDIDFIQIVSQLVCKMGRRLRRDNFTARGVGVSCSYRDGSWWQKGQLQPSQMRSDKDFFHSVRTILKEAPEKPVRIVAVRCFDLADDGACQMHLFENDQKKRSLTDAVDTIHDRWGEFTVKPARMLGMKRPVLDRIAFGNTKTITSVTLSDM